MANNVNWGWVNQRAQLLVPGAVAGEGRCEAAQFGVIAEDVVVYGDLENLRGWLRSALDQLPPSRDLVTVDMPRQWRWLGTLKRLRRPGWRPDVDNTLALLKKVVRYPEMAGWSLGLGVKKLWAVRDDDTADLSAGVKLVHGPYIGIGQPLTADHLSAPGRCSPQEAAHHALTVVAARINKAF